MLGDFFELIQAAFQHKLNQIFTHTPEHLIFRLCLGESGVLGTCHLGMWVSLKWGFD